MAKWKMSAIIAKFLHNILAYYYIMRMLMWITQAWTLKIYGRHLYYRFQNAFFSRSLSRYPPPSTIVAYSACVYVYLHSLDVLCAVQISRGNALYISGDVNP